MCRSRRPRPPRPPRPRLPNRWPLRLRPRANRRRPQHQRRRHHQPPKPDLRPNPPPLRSRSSNPGRPGASQPRPVGSGSYRPAGFFVLVLRSKSLSYVQIPPPVKVGNRVTAHLWQWLSEPKKRADAWVRPYETLMDTGRRPMLPAYATGRCYWMPKIDVRARCAPAIRLDQFFRTFSRIKPTMSLVSVPGPKMAAMPASFKGGMSSSGMMPPPITRTSLMPFSFISSMTRGNR